MAYTEKDHQNTMLNVYAGGLAALVLGLILFGILSLTGCAARVQHVTNLPAGVTEQQAKDWDAAVGDLHKIAVTTQTLRQAVITLNRDGLFPDSPSYIKALQAVGKIDQFQITAANYLQSAPQHFDAGMKERVAGYMQQIANALQELNSTGLTGIKNQNSLQQVNQLITELTATVNLVVALTTN